MAQLRQLAFEGGHVEHCVQVFNMTTFTAKVEAKRFKIVWDTATFSKLLRKILGRFLFLGKDPHFRNFLGISS